MTEYSLTIEIDSIDLPALRAAGEKIVLVRRLHDGGDCVAWAVLELAGSRKLAWNDNFTLLASHTPDVLGNTIGVIATADAVPRCNYDFDGIRFLGPVPDNKLAEDTLQIGNSEPAKSSPSLLILGQAYSIDRNAPGPARPINALSVPTQHFAQYRLSQELWIYLASSTFVSTIVPPPLVTGAAPEVASPAILLNFSAGKSSQAVRYDAVRGRFIAQD